MKAILVLITTLFIAQTAMADLMIYTDRNTALFTDAAAEFEAQTGEKIIFNGGSDYFALANQHEKAIAAGSPAADLFITKDIMFFSDLKARGLSQAFPKQVDFSKVHPSLQDEDRNYVALTLRARSIAYSPALVDRSELTTYEDLAGPQWKGRLCLRTGAHSYNISLVSYLVAKHGKAKAQKIVEGWMDNLAAPIFPNDRAILQAIATGQGCEVALVNHYYLAGAIASAPNFPVQMAFLEQGTGGVHTNGMGAVLMKSSKNEALAAQFVELLLTDKYQLFLSGSHFDYPAVQGLEANTFINTWESFEVDQTPWSSVGSKINDAIEVMVNAGYIKN